MMPIQANRDSFLRNLQQSGLLSTRDFRKVVDHLADLQSPRAIARALVDWGMVTKFQAEMLLVGRARGFFLGPYKILDQLGQGGMGRVYKALHQTMNRIVALKVLAPHLVLTPKAHKLFQREVRAAALLSHPNIVTAFDADEVNGRHYLAMEFVDGPTLEQLVRNQGPLPVGMACSIIRQVAGGLQHAHEHGMIHRDIKPANLLLQPTKNLQSFVVKILDFGLARLHAPGIQGTAGTIETKESTVMGTPDFLSPEQARNLHQADIRSDLYSLGCTFYFLLTGKVPFPGGTTLEKLLRHTREEPTPVAAFRQGVPVSVEAVLKRLMAKTPADRFQTPEELAAALDPFAVASARVWEGAAHHVPMTLNDNSATPKDGERVLTPPGDEMFATLSSDLSPTPLSGSGDLSLPWTDLDHDHRRQKRKALLWSIGIVGLLMATLMAAFFLFNP